MKNDVHRVHVESSMRANACSCMERGSFAGEFWASYCNQWGHSFVVVRERRTLLKLLWGGLVYNNIHTTQCPQVLNVYVCTYTGGS